MPICWAITAQRCDPQVVLRSATRAYVVRSVTPPSSKVIAIQSCHAVEAPTMCRLYYPTPETIVNASVLGRKMSNNKKRIVLSHNRKRADAILTV